MSETAVDEIRKRLEAEETEFLSDRAQLSSQSEGRARPEATDEIRTVYQRDRDRVLYAPSFRRLKFKTQVFIEPVRDDTRNRLTHTLEVMQISRTVARSLRLNEDLTEAISLGHDIGHTPFAHVGESVLDEYSPEGFHHSQQSVRMAEVLENQGDGLNLSREVKEGIARHSKSDDSIKSSVSGRYPTTEEGRIVRYCDSVAYLNHDIEDAVNAGQLAPGDLPSEPLEVLGQSGGQRIATSVRDIIETSRRADTVKMSEPVRSATDQLRRFMFENLYLKMSKAPIDLEARQVMEELYEFFAANPGEMYDHSPWLEEVDSDQPVVDFLSLQSDLTTLQLYREYFDDHFEYLPRYC